MKNLLLFFVLFASINSFSTNCVMCMSDGLYIYPDKEVISLNELIIIEGYAMSQNNVKSLSKRKVFLVSKEDKVLLNLKETNIGGMSLTQSLFLPSRDLKPNRIYYLEFENQTKEETRLLQVWNKDRKQREKTSFKTGSKKMSENNYQSIKYQFSETNVTHFGCGPAVFANFKISNSKSQKILHKIELLNLKNKKKRTYYLYSDTSEISIGHGMCSGAFTFNGKDNYKIRFTPINLKGKESKPSNWISFTNPYKDSKNRW